MKVHAPAGEKTQQKSQPSQQAPLHSEAESVFEDHRPESAAQQRFQSMAAESPRNTQLKSMQAMMAASPQVRQLRDKVNPTVQLERDGSSKDSGVALQGCINQLEALYNNSINAGAETAGVVELAEFKSRLDKLREISSGSDQLLQSQALEGLQSELQQAGISLGDLATVTGKDDKAVQRMPMDSIVQRITGIEIAAITTAVVGIGTLALVLYRHCTNAGVVAPPATGYGANPIAINPAANILAIAELESGVGPAVAFTGISSCLGIFCRNGSVIHAVHLPFMDASGTAVSTVALPVLLAAAQGVLGGGASYLVGEGEVWQGSGALNQFNAIDNAYGARSSFGSGNYSASIDGATGQTVIVCNGNEVLRGP